MEGIYVYKLVEKLTNEIESKNKLERELDKQEVRIDKLTEMLSKLTKEQRAFKHKILRLAFLEYSFEHDKPSVSTIHEKYGSYFKSYFEGYDGLLKQFSESDLIDFLLEERKKLEGDLEDE